MGVDAAVVTAARRAQFERLLVLRHAPEVIDEWAIALRDLPDDVLASAVAHALRTRVFFPLPAELRSDADAAIFQLTPLPVVDPDRERALPQPVTVTVPVPDHAPIVLHIDREWRYDCPTCRDTGWADAWCGPVAVDGVPVPHARPWWPDRRCERRRAHAPHAFVTPCACRDTNPTLRRHAEARARTYATPPRRG